MNGINETREDPIMQNIEKHYNNFDVYDYLKRNEQHDHQTGLSDFLIQSKAYYLIKYDQVYGTFTLYEHHIEFEADPAAKENAHLTLAKNSHLLQNRKLEDYKLKISLVDCQEINVLSLINENACTSDNTFI